MSYPKTFLTRPLRRAIMIVSIIIFFIATPSLLLYAAGYRYDWHDKALKQTGVLSIDAKPSDAAVYINGIKVNKRMPIRLSNRAPGVYTVKIEKNGYIAWQKQISIGSKQTTYIKDIILPRSRLPVRALPREHDILALHPSSDGRYIVLRRRNDKIETVELLDTETNATEPIARESRPEDTDIIWSPYGSALALISERGESAVVTLLSPAAPERTKIFSYESAATDSRLVWNQQGLAIAYIKVGDGIRRLSLSGEKIYQTDVPAGALWFVDADDNFWLADPNANTLRAASGDTIALPAISAADKVKIFSLNSNRTIMQVNDSTAVVHNKTGALKTLPTTTNVPHHSREREWISWSPWEIWAIYDDGNTEAVNRVSERINSVSPLEENGPLLMATEKGLFAFNPGYFVTQELFAGNVESAAVNRKARVIYFLGTVGNERGLYSLEY